VLEHDAVDRDTQKEVRRRLQHRARLRIRLQELLRADLERPLQHRAVVVALAVGLVDGLEKTRPRPRNLIVRPEVALDLPAEEGVATRLLSRRRGRGV
jgi:hypothetical protein